MSKRDLSDIMWETMKDTYRENVNMLCKEYENNTMYKMNKVYENGELAGFFVCSDFEDHRFLNGGYYLGKDKFVFLKNFRLGLRGVKVVRTIVEKANTKMLQFYKKMKFKIIEENLSGYLLERKVI